MRRVTAFAPSAPLRCPPTAIVSPAQAAFHLIEWSGNDRCQVWDESVTTKPWPNDDKLVSQPAPTLDAASSVKSGLMKRRQALSISHLH